MEYDFGRIKGFIYGPGPVCKTSPIALLRKDCEHISGLEVRVVTLGP